MSRDQAPSPRASFRKYPMTDSEVAKTRNSTPTPPEVPSQKNRLSIGSQPLTAKSTMHDERDRVWKSEPAAGAPERARVRPKNAGRTRSRPSANA